jgi:hypothetical protein
VSIAVMCNAANANAGAYAHAMVDALVPDFPPAQPLDTTAVDSATFARFVGVYRNLRMSGPLVVTQRMRERFRALPDGSFWSSRGGIRWLFDVGREGTPTGIRVLQSDGDTLAYAFAGREIWKPTPAQLAEFAGRYHSEELGVTYEVAVVSDTLTVRRRPGSTFALAPAYVDGFERPGGAVWFTRDRRGRVTAMHLGEGRVWDLVMSRVR